MKRHPRTLDHTPETLRELGNIARELSHDVDGHFDDLQSISNLLEDWADEKSGIEFDPKSRS